jgi:drug/metabolite transporter (DMT)-like permease
LNRLPPEIRGILLTLAATACFGVMDGLSKFLVTIYPPVLILWLRHLLAVPVVLAALGPGRLRALAPSARPWLQTFRVVLLIVEMGLVMVCFRLLPLADVHSLIAVTPLLVTALSVPMLGERVGWRRWLAVLTGFVGVLVIVRPGFHEVHPALLLALLCSAMYAVYNILTRKAARYDRAETSWLWQSLGGAVLLLAVGPFFWVTPAIAHWPLIVALAALGALGHYCLIRALALAPAVVVQPFTYTMLVWAIIIGYLAFGDLPDRMTMAGALLIVGAGTYAAWREHVRKQALA